MAYGPDMWTLLPPKRAKQVLFSMQRATLIGLISIMVVLSYQASAPSRMGRVRFVDRVKTPDGGVGKVVEFDTNGAHPLMAKVYVENSGAHFLAGI